MFTALKILYALTFCMNVSTQARFFTSSESSSLITCHTSNSSEVLTKQSLHLWFMIPAYCLYISVNCKYREYFATIFLYQSYLQKTIIYLNFTQTSPLLPHYLTTDFFFTQKSTDIPLKHEGTETLNFWGVLLIICCKVSKKD